MSGYKSLGRNSVISFRLVVADAITDKRLS